MHQRTTRRSGVRDGSRSPRLIFVLCVATTILNLLLGGGTRSGFLVSAILQLASLPLLGLSLCTLWETPAARPPKWPAFFLVAGVSLPLIQLIPLPPWIWTSLPGRGPLLDSVNFSGGALPWMPISMTPRATFLAALSVLPPLSIFLGTLLLSRRERRFVTLGVLTVGLFSVFLGLLQIAQGPTSELRFFRITNPFDAVGFFANRNHFAAFLYCLMLFAAAWAIHAAARLAQGWGAARFDTGAMMALAGSLTILIACVAAQAMARSRAGLALSLVALIGAFALALPEKRRAPRAGGMTLISAAVAAAAFLIAEVSLYRLLERLAVDPLSDFRVVLMRNTMDAARAYMPFGSGIGSFVAVYGLFEKPKDAMLDLYANRAHNDILELALEAGVAGLVLAASIAAWVVAKSISAWRPAAEGRSSIDIYLSRAGCLVIGLLIAHSFVDYPLRTEAMATIMAFCCALLIEPGTKDEGEHGSGGRRAEHRRPSAHRSVPMMRQPALPAERAAQSQPSPTREAGQRRWDRDIEWPAEWQKPEK